MPLALITDESELVLLFSYQDSWTCGLPLFTERRYRMTGIEQLDFNVLNLAHNHPSIPRFIPRSDGANTGTCDVPLCEIPTELWSIKIRELADFGALFRVGPFIQE